MRIPIICMQCVFQDASPEAGATYVEFSDDDIYEIQCPRGHREIKVTQQQRFEILFDIGAYAVRDGYYREAVTSFASSIERFYEFFIRSALYENGISEDVISATWKLVSSQSERQLGAYIFLYIQVINSVPPMLSTNSVSFRNQVIHKGRIPTRDEALDFGQQVLSLIREGLEFTKKFFPTGLNKTISLFLAQRYALAAETKNDVPIGTLSTPTIVGLNISESSHHSRTLEQAIGQLQAWR